MGTRQHETARDIAHALPAGNISTTPARTVTMTREAFRELLATLPHDAEGDVVHAAIAARDASS